MLRSRRRVRRVLWGGSDCDVQVGSPEDRLFEALRDYTVLAWPALSRGDAATARRLVALRPPIGQVRFR